jgi:chemotaxis protein CheD
MTHAVPSPLADSLPGFEGIKRFWDAGRGQVVAKILPGEFYLTRSDELVATMLGSCVSACIRDRLLGLGGMNHFLLPDNSIDSDISGQAMRYGSFAMEQLINQILKFGGQRQRLEAKLTGGGRIIEGLGDVGAHNIHFAQQYLAREGIELVGEDLGGSCPRKVLYHPASGTLRVKRLKRLRNDTLRRRERSYCEGLKNRPLEGEVELF